MSKRVTALMVMATLAQMFLLVGIGQAAVPRLINYQGRLTDPAGQPLTGPHQLVFRIFDAPTAGTQLWMEAQPDTADANGVFATILGSVTPLSLIWNEPRWLEVQVDNEVMLPRRHMVSTAYALKADDADNLGGLSSASFALVGHIHDDRYYTETELGTSDGTPPNQGANMVSWKILKDVPAGFADEIDDTATGGAGDITGVVAGNGLSGGGLEGDVTLDVEAGTGVIVGANAVALDLTYTDGRFVNESQANAVNSSMIIDGSVTPADLSFVAGDMTGVLAGSGLTGGGLSGDVTLSIATGGITSSMILDGQVATLDLQDGSVNSAKILDGTITAADMAFTPGDITAVNAGSGMSGGATSGDVTLSIATNAVTSSMIQDGTIQASDMAFTPGDITSVNAGSGLTGGASSGDATLSIGSGAVTSTMIQDAAVAHADLASNAVNSANIQDGTVTASDLAFTPGDITGVNTSSGLTGGGSSGEVTLSIQSGGVTSAMIADNTIMQSDVSSGYVDLSSGQTIGGTKVFTNQVQFTYTGNPPVYVTTTNSNGINVRNDAGTYPTVWAKDLNASGSNAIYGETTSSTKAALYGKNNTGDTGYINGVYGAVPSSSYYGIGTNGKGYFGGGVGLMTSVPTSVGITMMTTPLTRDIEIFLSGSAALQLGSTRVSFDLASAEMIAENIPIKVILTPTDVCNGLMVSTKSSEGFYVQELSGGKSNATFDWLVIARKAVSGGDKTAEDMPTAPPMAIEPESPQE